GLPADCVRPNGAVLAYGEIRLDRASLTWLAQDLPSIGDDLTRGSAWVTLWDAVLAGDLKPDAFLTLAIQALRSEKTELNVARILAYSRNAFWQFTPAEERAKLAPRLELVLRLGVDGAATPSLKSAYFSALRDVALTPDTLAWRTRVWKQEEKIPGLPLAETDYIRLAQELAVRGGPDAAAILDAQ